MIDLSRFDKLAECKDGIWTNLIPTNSGHENTCAVYMVTFANGDIYIGSSAHIRQRVNSHYWQLSRDDKVKSPLHNSYEKSKNFEIYLLVRTKDEKSLRYFEALFIDLLQPSLNGKPEGNKSWCFGELLFDCSETCRIVETSGKK